MNDVKEIQGNFAKSHTVKDGKKIVSVDNSYGGTDVVGRHGDDSDLYSYFYESGRTIELKRFEFCRVKIGMKACFKNEDAFDSVKYSVKDFVLQMVAREEAGVDGNEYKPIFEEETMSILNLCINRRIFVNYGLTLKAKKEFESHQVDTMEDIPVSNGDDILDVFEALSDKMAADISEEHDRIKNIGNVSGV